MMGYTLSDPRFKAMLQRQSKGPRGWKSPVFMQKLLDDPSPLFLREEWLYDEEALAMAAASLRDRGIDPHRLEVLFEQSNRFTPVRVQDLVDDDGVDLVMQTIEEFESDDGFRQSVHEIETHYGHYAYPDPLSFETMNAGIVRAITARHKLFLMDDAIRGPLYHRVGAAMASRRGAHLESILNEAAAFVTPLPDVGPSWTPDELDGKLRSTAADELRDTIERMREGNAESAAAYYNEALASIERVSPGDVICCLVGVSAAVATTALLPFGVAYGLSAVAGVVAVRQFLKISTSFTKYRRLSWPQLGRILSQMRSDNTG
ncbi:MAG: hypothetical protein O7D91_16970 [Planctomycetota bacterium]|nr:hypothetical protein [Planctomycetota bacterium]